MHLDYERPVFSRAMGGATVPFDTLLVSPSGTGMSMVRVTLMLSGMMMETPSR